MASAAEQPRVREQVVARPEDLPACCEHLAACPRFGLDMEFVGEDSYHPHLCLVQVATPERLVLIDPLSVGPLDAFWRLVTDAGRQVVVHAGREEVRLCRLWTGRDPGDVFDLQIAAGLAGLAYPLGHAALVSQLLSVRLAKGETLTEWRHRPLTRAQVGYAYDDVRYLLPLWEALSRRLAEWRRADWAREEFTRLLVSAAPEEAAVERWRRLRGLGALDRRRLAVVRELYRWREEAAARSNRPPRVICRDDLLVEIARRDPTREGDLKVVRGLSHRDLGSILEAARRARALSLEELPAPADRDQDPPPVTWVSGVLSAVLGDLCARRRLAANLVASGQDIKQLVRAHAQGLPPPDDSLLARGWRATHILPELLAVLEGRRALRVADVSADAPFAFDDDSATTGTAGNQPPA